MFLNIVMTSLCAIVVHEPFSSYLVILINIDPHRWSSVALTINASPFHSMLRLLQQWTYFQVNPSEDVVYPCRGRSSSSPCHMYIDLLLGAFNGASVIAYNVSDVSALASFDWCNIMFGRSPSMVYELRK